MAIRMSVNAPDIRRRVLFGAASLRLLALDIIPSHRELQGRSRKSQLDHYQFHQLMIATKSGAEVACA